MCSVRAGEFPISFLFLLPAQVGLIQCNVLSAMHIGEQARISSQCALNISRGGESHPFD
jgi:hypothetical protein